MIKKKLITLFTIMILTFTLAITASVSESASSVPAPKSSIEENVVIPKPTGFIDNLNENVKTNTIDQSLPTITVEEIKPEQKLPSANVDDITIYGTSRPNGYHNLAARNYIGSYWTNNSELYTNYYFSPNSSGKLYLGITTVGDPGTSYAYVYFYSKDSNNILLNEKLDVNKSYRITYSNLDVDKFYYMGFDCQSKGYGHDGSFTVSH